MVHLHESSVPVPGTPVTLQAAEDALVRLFEDSNLTAIHAKRVTICASPLHAFRIEPFVCLLSLRYRGSPLGQKHAMNVFELPPSRLCAFLYPSHVFQCSAQGHRTCAPDRWTAEGLCLVLGLAASETAWGISHASKGMFSQAISALWESKKADDALAKFVSDHAAELDAIFVEGHEDELRFAVSMFMDFKNPERALAQIVKLYKFTCDGVLQFSRLAVAGAGSCQETLVDRYAIDACSDMQLYKTLQDLAAIWATGGKADVHLSNVRAGHVPAVLKLIEANAAYCKSPYRVTVYLEPWHLDIFAFLADDSPHIDKVVWMPDALMTCIDGDQEWYLLDPSKAGGLSDLSGGLFEEAYKRHVSTGNAGGKVMARDLWQKIQSAALKGVGFKDRINAASPIPLAGTIKGCGAGSSLSGAHNHACVVTCSVDAQKLWDAEAQAVNHSALHEAGALAVMALDRMLDVTVTATPEARKYVDALRPIAITMTGSGDAEAWETLYHGALQASTDLASLHGSYFCFRGSHASCGRLPTPVSNRWDWKPIRDKLSRHGRRHAFLLAPPVPARPSDGHLEFFEHPLELAGDPAELWQTGLPCMALPVAPDRI